MTNNIQKTIEKVSNSFPSIFTKDDLLTSFRQMLSEKDWDNAADKDDVDFSIGYDNKLEVDRIAIDEDFIIDSAVDALEALWDVLEEGENED